MSPPSPAPWRRRRRRRRGLSSGLAASTRLTLSDRRRRSESISRILTLTSSPGLDDLARVLDVVLGELGDVHEALDPVHDLDERAEGDDLGDLALELVADAVGRRRPAATGPPGSA